jgi:hypothetical protein
VLPIQLSAMEYFGGEAGNAKFLILGDVKYEKPGDDGGHEQTQFHARVDTNDESLAECHDPKFRTVIKEVKPW